MKASFQTLGADKRAAAALELALVAPLLLILFFGAIEVTQLIRVSNKLTLAAQAIGNVVTDQNPATLSSVLNAYQAGELVMAPFNTTSPIMNASIASVTFNASGVASQVTWQITEGGATGMSVATACSLAASLSVGSDSVVVVKVSYSYSAVTQYILPASYALSYVAYSRPRNVANIAGVSSPSAPTGNC